MNRFVFILLLFVCHCLYGQNDTTIYTVVDTKARFKGGEDSLNSFIQKHLKYSEIAIDANTQGTVLIGCIIEADGSISKPVILRGLVGPGGKNCGQEALRLVNLLPNWNPAIVKGKPVRAKDTISVQFKLQKVMPKNAVFHIDELLYLPEDTLLCKRIDKLPEYPGGEEALIKWIEKTIRPTITYCPNYNLLNLHLIVKKDGRISAILFRSDDGQMCSDIYIDKLGYMTAFSPAKCNGVPISVRIIAPLHLESR